MRLFSGIRQGLLAAVLLIATPVSAQNLPQSEAEWDTLGDKLLLLYRSRSYASVLEYLPTHGEAILAKSPGHYTATISLARALFEAERYSEALPYYEKALQLQCLFPILKEYAEATLHTSKPEAFEALSDILKQKIEHVGLVRTVEAYRSYLSMVKAGDIAYLSGKLETAKKEWTEAFSLYENIAKNADKTFPNRPAAALQQAYTYQQLYLSQYGRLRLDLLVSTFLEPKLALCEPLPQTDAPPLDFRVTAFVIKDTDLRYRSTDGKEHHERSRMDDATGKEYQAAWKFATDALHYYSGGKVKVQTLWHHLPDAVITKLDERMWKGIVPQRLIDPAGITPRQDQAFTRAAKFSDAVIFVWPRGLAAEAYGGGSIKLPLSDGTELPARGVIRSISRSPHICFHELLHTIEAQVKIQPVHGPVAIPMREFQRLRVEDEIDWYIHLVRTVPDWTKWRYRDP